MRRVFDDDEESSPAENIRRYDEDQIVLHSNRTQSYIQAYQQKRLKSRNTSKNLQGKMIIAIVIGAIVALGFLLRYSYVSFQLSYFKEKTSQLQQQKINDLEVHKTLDQKIKGLERASNELRSANDLIERNKKQINVLTQELLKYKPESPVNRPTSSSDFKRKEQPKASEEFKFRVPKFVWLYLDNPPQRENYITQRNIENIKWYGRESGFDVRIVSKDNYGNWLSPASKNDLDTTIKRLEAKRSQFLQLNSKFETVRQHLIMLNLMKELGGVIIKKNYIFTEKLDWLEDIKTNILVNTGNPYAKPQYFAFLSLADGPEGKKENKKAEIDVDKYMIIFPGPKEYFLAGMPNGDYIRDLLAQYTYLVEHTTEIGQIMDQYRVQAGQLDRNNLHMAYTLASQIVVQRRQRELDERGEKFEGGFGRFAVDEYGLFTMNSFFFPDKMWFYFNNRLRYHDNFFNYAAKMPQDEFEESIGPLRYLANPDPYGEFNRRIEDARNGGKYEIVEGSFLQRHLFGDKPYAFVKPNRERRTSAAGKAWENLPKTLWLYWDSGSQAASASNQLCILNLIKNAKAAGYDVKEVNDNNANEYLPAETLNKIKNAISTANMPIRPQTKSDLYRLGLISTHGGIYLDSSYFFLEDFSWITYVSKEPSQLFYNRFGEVPKVLMQFHPIQGGPLDWTVDEKANTKVTWHLAYESNFLAADKDSEFVKDWFDLFLYFVKSPYPDTETKMKECNMVSHKWTNQWDRYLTVMDSLKAVLGCKQRQIDNNKQAFNGIVHATDYYKFWSFNGFTGIQKFRFYNNYANAYRGMMNEDNLLMYRFSQDYAEAVYGRVYKTVKLYGFNIGNLNNFMNQHRGNNFSLEAHPDSLFMRYLFNPKEHEFYVSNQLHVRNKN